MSSDDNIRVRAYALYLADTKRTSPKVLDDWLDAEREALAQELASASGATYNQDSAYHDGDVIADMFNKLPERLRRRRSGSVLLRRIEEYQDYLTDSNEISHAQAIRVGTNALHIYRLGCALHTLGVANAGRSVVHSVYKELKDLFSNDEVAYETASYNIASAALLQRASGLEVTFIEEADFRSPDLRVGNLAYVECKDLHPAKREGIALGLRDQLDKAIIQLNSAWGRDALVGTGVCIDVPWGTLPLEESEWSPIREALQSPNGPMFVLVTCSGAVVDRHAVSFPTAVALVTRQSVPKELYDVLLRKLAPIVSTHSRGVRFSGAWGDLSTLGPTRRGRSLNSAGPAA
jgi:hypothetical protein